MIYIFTRNKKTGLKKVVKEIDSVEDARHFCIKENLKNQNVWYEFTGDFEWTKN